MARPVLLTRPHDDSILLAKQLRRMGRDCLIAPMMTIRPTEIHWPAPEGYAALVVTSAHALTSVPAEWIARQPAVYTVGRNSEDKARMAGFRDVVTVAGDAAALNLLLVHRDFQAGEKLFHPCGRDTASRIDAGAASVDAIPVYIAEPVVGIDADIAAMIRDGGVSDILFFSPRTARIFVELAEKQAVGRGLSMTKALCLSNAVLESARGPAWEKCLVAAHPDRDGMIDLLQ